MLRSMYLLLAICLLFSIQLDAQKKKKPPKSKHEVFLGLGYFNHGKISRTSEIYFSGFKTINLGYSKKTTNKIFQAELQFYRVAKVNASFDTPVDEIKNGLTISGSSLYSLKQAKTSQLFGGFFCGILAEKAKSEPQSTLSFPVTEAKLGVFSGLELRYILSFSKISIFADGKLGLVDVGYTLGKVEDPNLPIKAQVKYEETHFLFKPRTTLTIGASLPIKN